MSDTGDVILKVLETAEKHGLIDRIKALFAKERTVLVLGTSGVGKTSLLNSLNGLIPETIHHLSRTEIARQHKLKFDGAKIVFVDTPGQEHHDSRRLEAIREGMKHDHLGVINVASYGYHENSTGAQEAFNADGTVSQAYLTKYRALEISALQEWAQLLGDRATTRWFMTVVTKADLWWNDRLAVGEYYKNGSYYQSLSGVKQLQPVVIEYCSVVHRFYDRGQVSGTFDDSARNLLRANFLKALIDSTKCL